MILFGLPVWLVVVFLFFLGATLGSFLNVCIYRIPQREPFWDSLKGLVSPPSSCPRCGARIGVRDNIPILSWLLLRGRCRRCRTRIAIRYPLIELGNALLFVAVYLCEIPTDFAAPISESGVFAAIGPQGIPGHSWLSPVAVLHWRYFYHMVLLEALVVATFIDFDLKIIPDGCTLPAMAVGLLGGFLVGQVYLVPAWFQSPELEQFASVLPGWMHPFLQGPAMPPWFAEHPHWHGLLVSVLGLLVGGGIAWIVRIIGQLILRQEAMGFGDVILMATIGSFLGWQPTVMIFFLAPLCALAVFVLSVFFHRHREIPYGPYLSMATLLVILFWRPIWSFAERIFAMGPFVIFAGAAMAAILVLLLSIIQAVKWMVGIPLYPVESLWSDEWTSADQLAHFAGETWDEHQGLWRPGESQRWPGEDSGRGTLYDGRWRRGS